MPMKTFRTHVPKKIDHSRIVFLCIVCSWKNGDQNRTFHYFCRARYDLDSLANKACSLKYYRSIFIFIFVFGWVCVCVCVCLWGGGWAEWAWSGIKCCSRSKIFVTLIFHDHLHYCEIFLAPFLISSVFNKAATIVLHKISSLHIVWFSHINICVVTKQMRDKTTRKVNKWPVTKATLRFFL